MAEPGLVLTLGSVTVNLATLEVHRTTEVQPLSPAEASLLRCLYESAPATVSRTDLQVRALQYAPSVQTRAVDHAMARLRKKVEPDPKNPQFLIGVRGIGYRLEVSTAATTSPIEAALIGRNDLLGELLALQDGVHLLHGPGGVGKSTLARALTAARPGSLFVPLADAHDLPTVLDLLGQRLDLTLRGTEDNQWHQIGVSMTNRETRVVVLDNLEQLPSEVVDAVVQRLRTQIPVLVMTSRHSTSAAGVVCHAVTPLPVPHAITLYEERARTRLPGFALTQESQGHLESFLEVVDCLPLAIELAASRVAVMAPHDLARRGARILSMRGQSTDHSASSLDECIALSWELLDKPLRESWTAATVFEGGFDLDAFEAVTGLADATDHLQTLLEFGLLESSAQSGGARRFTWLQSLRSFAVQQVAASGLESELRDRHLAHYASACRERARFLETTGDLRWAIQERSNLLKALSTRASDCPDDALDIHRVLEIVFQERGPASQRLALAEQMTAAWKGHANPAYRSYVQGRLALALVASGRAEAGLAHEEATHALLPDLQQPDHRARRWMCRGAVMLHLGRFEEASDAMADCAKEALLDPTTHLTGLGWYNQAYALLQLGRIDDALRQAHKAVAELRETGGLRLVKAAETLVATIHHQAGDLDAAHRNLRGDQTPEHGRSGLVWLDHQATLARVLCDLGELTEALELADALLVNADELGIPTLTADLHSVRARTLLRMERLTEAQDAAHVARAYHERLGSHAQAVRASEIAAEASARLKISKGD